jgi:hypothetical protein
MIRCATWWIHPHFTSELSLHCYSWFRILLSPYNNCVSDNYGDGNGGDVEVASAEFTWEGDGVVGDGGKWGSNSANVLLLMVIV